MAARARRARPQREERRYLPGIADIRICGDEATIRKVLDVLDAEFRTTTAQKYSGGQRAYLQLDTGCTDPDAD
ncbi:hypothetical protein [Streptomyces sp. NPDC047315]|uniref:hypothetical protein n=1 Tax=Streptomyces sp. NPDC047315 TaxID=3155142 RepID=UPI0034008941